MQSDYTFLTDHSYSIRLDNNKSSLKHREMKNKKPRGTSNRSNATTPTNRTASIDRSSSDKENNSSSPMPTINTSGNKNKSSTKKKTAGSRLPGKKANNKTSSKTGSKSIPGSIIKKKKTSASHPMDISDAPLSLSIEERVKLRRTTPFLTSQKQQSDTNRPIKKPTKRIQLFKPKKNNIKPKKFFLGSGLDLDNIVLGNRQRRSVQT